MKLADDVARNGVDARVSMGSFAYNLLHLRNVLFDLFSEELEFKGLDLLSFNNTMKVHLTKTKQKAQVITIL